MQEFYYNRVEDGTFCLTGYVGDEAEVVIPDDHFYPHPGYSDRHGGIPL